MKGARIFLARHGITRANVDRIRAGASEVPLIEEGRQQARRLAEKVQGLGLGAVWTSPLDRARETAEVVARACGVSLHEHPDLRELEAGVWEGLTDEQIRVRFPEAFAAWEADPASFRPEGGETLEAVRRRVVAAVEEIRARGVDALVVSHCEPIRLLRVHYAGLELNRFAEFLPQHGQLFSLVPGNGGDPVRPVA